MFDAVLLNLPDATTLVANRYLTREFFSIAEIASECTGCHRCPAGGRRELRWRRTRGARCLGLRDGQRGLSALALTPGDESWLFASTAGLLTEDALELGWRWRAIPGAKDLFPVEASMPRCPPIAFSFSGVPIVASLSRPPIRRKNLSCLAPAAAAFLQTRTASVDQHRRTATGAAISICCCLASSRAGRCRRNF